MRKPPRNGGPIVGYYGIIADPDGYNLELTFGQMAVSDMRGNTEIEK